MNNAHLSWCLFSVFSYLNPDVPFQKPNFKTFFNFKMHFWHDITVLLMFFVVVVVGNEQKQGLTSSLESSPPWNCNGALVLVLFFFLSIPNNGKRRGVSREIKSCALFYSNFEQRFKFKTTKNDWSYLSLKCKKIQRIIANISLLLKNCQFNWTTCFDWNYPVSI